MHERKQWEQCGWKSRLGRRTACTEACIVKKRVGYVGGTKTLGLVHSE